MHKVFVSFHHANDQKYKEGLVSWAEKNKVCESAVGFLIQKLKINKCK